MIYIIVPYRNREKQLEIFTKYTNYLFQVKNIDFKIFICEQNDDKPFNRGLVINSGIKYLIDKDIIKDNDFLIISDIDCLCPENNFENYIKNPEDTIRHIYGYSGLFHNVFYSLGTVISLKVKTFKKINGFPNNYWGWGAEDLALGIRAKVSKIHIDNTNLIPINDSKFYQFDNPNNEPNLNEKLLNNSKNLLILIDECTNQYKIAINGLMNCNSDILESDKRDFIMLSINFKNPI